MHVGGTGKLPMTTLAGMCQTVGFEKVKTYIASGNVVFRSDRSEDLARSALEDQLHSYARKSVGVIVRTSAEIADRDLELHEAKLFENPNRRRIVGEIF